MLFCLENDYPEACGMTKETADDGNITRLLKSYKSWNNQHFTFQLLLTLDFITRGIRIAFYLDIMLSIYLQT